MISAWPVCILGFFLGMRHATDADHIVAVATIVSRECKVRVAARIGALWGVGHTMTIATVGGVIIAFNVAIPPKAGLLMELGVGVMLVLLGLLNVSNGARKSGQELVPGERTSGGGGQPTARPVIIGIIHGLAGSAGITLLVLTTVRQPMWAIAYLLVFGAGTIAGMILITTTMAVPFAFSGNHFRRTNRGLATATGLLSLCFGLFLAYRIGVSIGGP
ncbi:MAG TPA: hypothetical protein VNZ26_27405 [Vicinamibacterales bacterium]|nr:hypothetical protein [Vicinamibacterales bacterium]